MEQKKRGKTRQKKKSASKDERKMMQIKDEEKKKEDGGKVSTFLCFFRLKTVSAHPKPIIFSMCMGLCVVLV